MLRCKACHTKVTLYPKTFPDPVHANECPNNPLTAEIDRLRSHVSRLEESLRVALEARAEAVEVLRMCEWGDRTAGRRWCPVCSGIPGTLHFQGHAPDCRLARAIGGAE